MTKEEKFKEINFQLFDHKFSYILLKTGFYLTRDAAREVDELQSSIENLYLNEFITFKGARKLIEKLKNKIINQIEEVDNGTGN